MILLPTRLPSKGYLYKSEDFICKKKKKIFEFNVTRVQRYLQNNGHLYRTQSTVYLKKKKKLQCSGVLDYQHCIKEKTKTSGSRRTDTYIYRKQTKLFVAVLFMWSLHCASLYHVLIKKKNKKKHTENTNKLFAK